MKGQSMRRSYAWFLGTVGVAAAFAIGLLIFGNQFPSFGKTQYSVSAALPNASALTSGARVTMAGLQVGTVKSVERRGLGALVKLSFDDTAVTPLPRDSVARVRLRTGIGENYIEVTPGRDVSHTLASGQMLPIDQAEGQVDIDTILSVLQGRTRGRAREVVNSLGPTLDGHGTDLNTLLGGTAGTIDNAARITDVLYQQKAGVSRLVDQLGQVMASIGERDAAIKQVGDEGLKTLTALGNRDDAVRQILQELPSTLDVTRKTSQTLDAVTGTAAPVLTNLGNAMRDLQPAIENLEPATTPTELALLSLASAAPDLTRTLNNVKAIGQPAAKALPQVRQALCELNPTLRYLKPYTPDFLATLVGLSSSTNGYDAIGHLVRLTPTISDNTLAGLPDDANQAAYTLIHAGLLQDNGKLTYNPYPAPGREGKDVAPKTGGIIGPEAFAKTGYKYPRIKAAC